MKVYEQIDTTIISFGLIQRFLSKGNKNPITLKLETELVNNEL